MKKLGFVIPWFGKKISGGAELELKGLAEHLNAAGVEVEILATCVKEFSADWNQNYYPEGVEVVNGIPVRRFRVRKRDTQAFDGVNYKLLNQIPLSSREEEIYAKEMVNSPDLYAYLKEKQEEYGAYIFIPYMFGTTYYGVQVCPQKTVMIPCFHDESYAHMEIFKSVFSKVAGMLFLAQPECDLAHRLFDLSRVKTEVMGAGVDTNMQCDARRFREKYNIRSPFILYAGRKDAGKNVDTLVKYFAEYKKRNSSDLKLVLIGGGKIEIPQAMKGEILDLGFLPLQDKVDAYGASTFLCQPSKMESFSLVIMESWLGRRPVLVYEGCEVTTHFAKCSHGGLYFANFFDFEGCVNYFMQNPVIANQMGEEGRRFVLENFSWEVIVNKFCAFMENLVGSDQGR
ncbi:glycosyltransferase family 4 protein [Cuneatibacter sp. NSJ-177]|uniref:glycosyltransferase family 4 protein n=1 Tax=Cuneatibacter sp. NSJ-177 TaxID=2931401 RepID=UPI001FD5B286|nr:glycosyltransferase family 4 protein [Cuneatibacter sp. NSJ-177]MCJ7833780.1 glycosyltransferase family 4 protein [Cuneatibacter sp. NSJ-177]